MLTAQANDICNKEKKKTIFDSHVRDALAELGMEAYLEGCPPPGDDDADGGAKKKRKLKPAASQYSHEEL
eukprot:3956302-Prymnesium_polylepis.1